MIISPTSFVVTLDYFAKFDLAHCQEHQYEEYDNLDKAIRACFEDNNCLAVYDNECDGANKYTLCPVSEVIQYSGKSKSCLHRKKEYSGII